MTPGTAQRADRDFVGRTDEIALLADLVGKVRFGQHGTVVIQGAAGIGKSSLIRRFLATIGDFAVLSATGDPAESLLDLGVIDQLLLQTPADIRARTASLGSGAPTGANPLAVGSQLLDVLGELQRRSPVALVVDDVQWADHSSLETLRFVLRRLWTERLIVVLATRTGTDQSPDPALERLIRGIPADLSLELTGLDLVDVSDLARALAGRQLPAGAARRFHSYTGGHPLMLRTMLNEISSQRFSSMDWRLAVPPSVDTAIRQTFDKLPSASRSLLEALAVLGGRPLLSQAADVAGLGSAHHALGPAIEAGLATWSPAEPAGPVAITHDLQREAIYGAMSPARRSQLHERAATTVEPFLAWRHRVAAAGTTDATLAAQLEQAAEDEAADGDHGTAATFLDWAAGLTPWSPRSEQLLLRSMIHLMLSSRRGRAKQLRERAYRCAPSALRSLALGLCDLYMTGDRSSAERHLLHAFGATGEDTWVHGSAAAGMAGVSVWRGQDDDALVYAELALGSVGVPAPLRDYVCCLRGVARARKDGLPAGLEEFRYLSEHAADIPSRDLEALSCRGALRAMVGLVEEAQRDLAEVVRRQEAGAPMLSGVTPHCYLAAVQYQLGEWNACVRTLRRASMLADDDQPAMNDVILSFVASIVPSARGDWDTADQLVRTAVTAAQRVGGPQDLKYAAIAAALFHQARGDHSGVLRALSAVPNLRNGGTSGLHEWWSPWWQPLLIDALQATGQLREAASELSLLRKRTGSSVVLSSTLVRLSAQQAAAEGDLPQAIALAARHLSTTMESRPRLADGQLYHAHARHHLQAGNIRAATHWLTTADECFTALLAAPYRDRARAELAALTTHPAAIRSPRLTAREREVVDLVLANRTNREIAATLHVSPKTVEYHLRNIFTRLGITSRRDLHTYF